MDTFLLRVHQQQVLHQCHAATLAINQASDALDNRRTDQEVFWAGIQNFLTAAANISKACWGAGGNRADERRPLRESLAIEDDNPLSNTDLRNHLEHYDERLDRWYKNSEQHNYVDYLIAPAGGTALVGPADTDIFRRFDPSTGDVIFWGEHYSIPALRDAIQDLLPIAAREAEKHHLRD
jgi:hypothetical protein